MSKIFADAALPSAIENVSRRCLLKGIAAMGGLVLAAPLFGREAEAATAPKYATAPATCRMACAPIPACLSRSPLTEP
jgi:hypothetical protein